jgi:hypothetical protein
MDPKINWEQLLQIDDKWVDKHLVTQAHTRNFKKSIRGYSLKFSGTKNSHKSFTEELSELVGYFTNSKSEVNRIGEKKALKLGEKIFGNIPPSTEGKYGELILFTLVESILRCPMIAHKIPSSFNDQVKGGDGIFLGNYEYEPGLFQEAILIGESKIWQNYASALADSLESIDRFHGNINSSLFNAQEFIVAKRGMVTDTNIDYDTLYRYLSPGEDEHNSCIHVHPTFIMYETNVINSIERDATTRDIAESLIKSYLTKRHDEHIKLINDKILEYPDLDTIYLDFFILPVKSVDDFRNALFLEIHGIPYTGNSNSTSN